SGSGATCFGLFPSETAAQRAAAFLATAHPNWWIRATVLGSQAQRAWPRIS
ncbi:MAG: 4-(cytidine 5'-diphospho)-2-C-methyl-D-erythritol kinase, partial [Pseudomonadota bacterium]